MKTRFSNIFQFSSQKLVRRLKCRRIGESNCYFVVITRPVGSREDRMESTAHCRQLLSVVYHLIKYIQRILNIIRYFYYGL